MPRKNHIFLHEAIVLALISKPSRAATYKEIETFIIGRNLILSRKGNISLEKQIMLRATKSKGAYAYLFEDLGNNMIRLRDHNPLIVVDR